MTTVVNAGSAVAFAQLGERPAARSAPTWLRTQGNRTSVREGHVQTALLAVVVLLIGYAYLEPADSMMRVHNAFAYVGHVEAQNQMAQKYLQDAKSAESSRKAIDWLRLAAANGHAEAAYNLAVSHLKGHVVLTKGQARRLLHHAAKHNVDEAHFILTNVCRTSSDCD